MQVLRVVTIAALVALCRGDATNSSSTTAAAAAPQPDALGPGYNRTRRSDVLGLFNTKLHKKYALLGSLSSSNHHLPETTGPDCGHPLTYDHKSFSLWGFKKAIFSTLLQAIKAITGGVIALKGQIIKVKGHLIAAKGHLLQTKGEAITDFGRHIATKALLNPVHVPPSATGLSAFGHTGASGVGVTGTGYVVPKPVYGAPPPSGASGPGYSYSPPPKAVYGPPNVKMPPSSYGPPPSFHSAPSAPSASPSGSYGAPPPPLPSSAYGPPPPPLPSTSYGTPVGSGHSHNDYNGPPPPSGGSHGGSGVFLPPSFPSAPSGPGSPSTGYGSPLKRDLKLPDGVQAGLLVLKPIQAPTSSLGVDPRHVPRVRKSLLRAASIAAAYPVRNL